MKQVGVDVLLVTTLEVYEEQCKNVDPGEWVDKRTSMLIGS